MKIVNSLAWFALLSILTGCGGGGDSGSNGSFGVASLLGATAYPNTRAASSANAAPADGAARESASSAVSKGPAIVKQKLDGDWASVASEGESFAVADNIAVRYGTDEGWVEKMVSGPGDCTTEFFGIDPSPAMLKGCSARALGRPARH